jgi:hypothetical protein
MLKEHLADAIDKLVSVSNKGKINSLIEKFDTEATKAHRMMQQSQQDMVTMHTDCVNAIYDVLSGYENNDVDDNDNIHDEGKDAYAQVVNDNVQQTTNATMEGPLHRDQFDNNRNQDEQEDLDAQHVDDTVEQRSNTASDDPRPDDARTDNDEGTEWMEPPTQSPQPDVSSASPLSLSCS